jgi:hypothetical protein
MSGSCGGLCARIYSDGDVSNSSMSLTAVTAINNNAGTMSWGALLQQHGLWVLPVDSDSDGLCVCVRDGGLSSVCEQYCVGRPRCRESGTLMVCACTPGATTMRPLMFTMAEADVTVS